MDAKGFYKKYEIKRTDGQPIPADEEHFILRLDSDQAAREAALYYARITGNSKLENDLVFMYSRRNLRFDQFYELKHIHCFDRGESARDVGIGDHRLIGTLELDPGHPSSRDDPGDPAALLFVCHKCGAGHA